METRSALDTSKMNLLLELESIFTLHTPKSHFITLSRVTPRTFCGPTSHVYM